MDSKNSTVSGNLLQQILFIQSDNGCSLLVLRDRKQCILEHSLAELESLLPPSRFYRVHRSYIVNMTAVSEFRYFRKQLLAVMEGYRIPISRRRKRIVMESLEMV